VTSVPPPRYEVGHVDEGMERVEQGGAEHHTSPGERPRRRDQEATPIVKKADPMSCTK
jgi:hypothetical protein